MSRVRWVIGSVLLVIMISILLTGMNSSAGRRALVPLEEIFALSRHDQSLCPEPKHLGFPTRGLMLQVPQDFPTIQAAIDTAPDGAMIRIAPGTYQENLIIRRSVWLQGAGRDQVTLKGAREGLSAVLIASGSGIDLRGRRENIQVILEGLTITDSSIGVEVLGLATSVLIRHNTFRRNFPHILILPTAVLLPSSITSGGTMVCGNILEEGGNGIYAVPGDSYFLWVEGNLFRALGEGIRIEKSYGGETEQFPQIFPHVRISRNTMQSLSSWGILLLDSSGVEIRENTIESGHSGVSLSRSEAIIDGNVIRGQTASGIGISGDQALLKGNRIESNGIDDKYKISGGVVIESGQVALVENHITNNLGYGILARRVENIIVCQSNQVSGNSAGDYAFYDFPPKASPELKQKCEGG